MVKSKGKKSSPVEVEVENPVILDEVKVVVEAKTRIRVGEVDFMKRLTEKLTHFDAKLVLEAAMISAGVSSSDKLFKKEETKDICLALIKRGGPAFSVGTGIYREVIG